MDTNDLSRKIKDARKDKGFSQEALANVSSISLRTIQRIEKGVIPRDSTLKILCENLGLEFNDFTNQSNSEARTIKRMNLSIILLIFIPLFNVLIPFLIWKMNTKMEQLKN